jgi:hypothetical protein
MTFAKCCWRCGRWGTHQFRPSNFNDCGQGRDWECANDRACRRRAETAAPLGPSATMTSLNNRRPSDAPTVDAVWLTR